ARTAGRHLSERLFVAVWPADDVLEVIAALPRPSLPGVRWTSRDQWHVTLRFLGDAGVDEVTGALGRVRAAPTEAALGPRTHRLGRGVLCVPITGLDDLAAAVIDATATTGEPPDHRTFRGHLTLARVEGRTKPPLVDLPPRRWTVATFALVRSHLGGGPARYETVTTWNLDG
ncbi:MAG TPA: RNA 2',3'-cyclic phosphodiesterase, partial [Acidimicrobiales bacterium]|nr:RNA 2',3'-cyclic phosphodiesterase [Acidimicrobiales bacterium]